MKECIYVKGRVFREDEWEVLVLQTPNRLDFYLKHDSGEKWTWYDWTSLSDKANAEEIIQTLTKNIDGYKLKYLEQLTTELKDKVLNLEHKIWRLTE